MPFSVNILKETDSPVIGLKDEHGNSEARIYAFGAILNEFSIKRNNSKANVIDGFASPADAIKNITAGFKSAKLSPFVCRLNKGEYSFEGQHHKIRKHYLGEEAIHGLIYNALFEIDDYKETNSGASVILSYAYNNKQEGFPYSYKISVEYTLEEENKLTITTMVENTGDKNFPLSDGWHPYFSLGETVNDISMQLNSNQMVEFDERLLPTGNVLYNPAFETLAKFGDTFLDNCFLLDDFEKPSCIVKDKKAGLQLSVSATKTYPYLQVYTPPHRKSLAIENLTSPPDSFNNNISLIIAEPGKHYSFKTTYQLTAI